MTKKALFITTICLISAFFIFGNFASADYRDGLTVDERVSLEQEERNLNPIEVIALTKAYRSHVNDAVHEKNKPAMCTTRTELSIDEQVELKREEGKLNPNEVSALINKYTKQGVKNTIMCDIKNLRAGLSVEEHAKLDREEMK